MVEEAKVRIVLEQAKAEKSNRQVDRELKKRRDREQGREDSSEREKKRGADDDKSDSGFKKAAGAAFGATIGTSKGGKAAQRAAGVTKGLSTVAIALLVKDIILTLGPILSEQFAPDKDDLDFFGIRAFVDEKIKQGIDFAVSDLADKVSLATGTIRSVTKLEDIAIGSLLLGTPISPIDAVRIPRAILSVNTNKDRQDTAFRLARQRLIGKNIATMRKTILEGMIKAAIGGGMTK